MNLKEFVQLFKIHHWVKNLLVFVPVVMAHRFTEKTPLVQAGMAFFAFSFCASGIYLINDWMDLAADRRHPEKKSRSLAKGAILPPQALAASAALLAAAFGICLALPAGYAAALAVYAVLAVLYSAVLKRVAMLDVLVLAFFYVLRIISGSMATGVPTSNWLLAFAMFFFLSLAFVKRASELGLFARLNQELPGGRDYSSADAAHLGSFGTASGYIAVLVLALYVNGREVTALYSRPALLWLICPLLLYWISRVWLLTFRGLMRDDPVLFALKDRTSYLVGALAALVIFFAV